MQWTPFFQRTGWRARQSFSIRRLRFGAAQIRADTAPAERRRTSNSRSKGDETRTLPRCWPICPLVVRCRENNDFAEGAAEAWQPLLHHLTYCCRSGARCSRPRGRGERAGATAPLRAALLAVSGREVAEGLSSGGGSTASPSPISARPSIAICASVSGRLSGLRSSVSAPMLRWGGRRWRQDASQPTRRRVSSTRQRRSGAQRAGLRRLRHPRSRISGILVRFSIRQEPDQA